MDSTTKKRCDELYKSLEMKFSFGENAYIGAKSYNEDFNVYPIEIQCDSEEEWNEKIEKLKKELTKRQANEIR